MRLSKRIILALLCALALSLTVVLASSPIFATTFTNTNTSTSRGTVIDNAVELSYGAYRYGAPAAVVANADDWRQSAGASVLARASGGPMLVASTSGASSGTLSELRRLRPSVVYVVGLSASVGAQIDSALATLSPRPQVVTLIGADANATAALVARQVEAVLGGVERVVVVPSDYSGGVMAASAMAAANGWPILLTPKEGPFPQVSSDTIVAMGATSGINVGTSVAPTIEGFSVDQTFLAVVTGDDPDGRHGLCAEAAEWAVSEGFLSYERVGAVYCWDRVTSEVMAAHIAPDRGVMVLCESSSLSDITRALLRARGAQIERLDTSGVFWGTYREIKSLNSARVTSVSPGSGPVAGGSSVVVQGTDMDTASSIVIGKVTLPSSDWRIDSSAQLTITSTPEAYGAGPAEIIVNNYWNRSPASTSGLYRYSDGSPELPGDRVVDEAIKHLGVPYKWGEELPSVGFDCSGLCQYVFGRVGVDLPRVSYNQATTGMAVSTDAMLPGDLVHFGSPVYHVGIYVGGGLMINAPRSGDLVTIENVYRSSLSGARRHFWPYTRYQQEDSLLSYSGPWQYSNNSAASGDSRRYVNSTASVTLTFNGTYLAWIGKKAPHYGIARVTLDNGTPVEVDLFSWSEQYQKTVWHTGLIDPGRHTVKIEWTGDRNANATDTNIGVDAFDLLGSLTQVSTAPPGSVLIEQSDPRMYFLGDWSTSSTSSASGGTITSTNAPGSATVSFNGSYLSVLGKTAPYYGKARVFLDGEDMGTIDYYNPTVRYLQTVYETGIIEEGEHTLTLEWTGEKHDASQSYLIGMDAVEVLGELTEAPRPVRYEENVSGFTFTDEWDARSESLASGGSYVYLDSTGSATVSFEGTYLAWIATKSDSRGKAWVAVDGGDPELVDLYNSYPERQQVVWNTGLLSEGTHTVSITWAGVKSGNSDYYGIGVDAFEVIGTLVPDPESPTPLVRYEDGDSDLAYSGGWGQIESEQASGGTYRYINSAGSVTVDFEGTFLTWLANTSSWYGIARVTLDAGTPLETTDTVDLYSPAGLRTQAVWNSGVLEPGSHTLTIEWTGERNAGSSASYVNVDAFDVMGTLSDVGTGTPPVTRVEQTDPRMYFLGAWTTGTPTGASGGSVVSIDSPGRATVSFSGTYLSVLSKTAPYYGIAQVFLDGEDVGTIDYYSSSVLYQQKVYETGIIDEGEHTLVIEWTGQKRSASWATIVGFDAVNVVGELTEAPRPMRYEENTAGLTFTGEWETRSSSTASGEGYRYLDSTGSVTVSFEGTYLTWIASKSSARGKAWVVVDGGDPRLVDLYSSYSQPQEAVWNTGLLPEGTHTVSIIWSGLKNGSSYYHGIGVDAFEVVGTLVPDPEPPTTITRYEETDPQLAFSGAWGSNPDSLASAGAYHYINSAGSVTVEFEGTFLVWIANTARWFGKALVTLDAGTENEVTAVVDLYSYRSRQQRPIWNTGMLDPGSHTLTIEWTGQRNSRSWLPLVNVDAFDVMGTLNEVGAGPAGATRFEQTDPRMTFLGEWTTGTPDQASGDSLCSTNSSAGVMVSFSGTYLSVLSKTAPYYGIAQVFLDGEDVGTIDYYSSSVLYQQKVYETGIIDEGEHTLVIEWTGQKRSASWATMIGIDAVEVVGGLIEAPTLTAFEEGVSQIALAGSWEANSSAPSASGGSFIYANSLGASVTVDFEGTYLAWVAKKSPVYGRAKVSLDGGEPETVDLYSDSEQWQQQVWTSGLLSSGPHTVTIQWSWGRNDSATDTNLSFDGVQVLGTLSQADPTVLECGTKVVMIDPGHQAVANYELEPVGPGSSTMKAKVSAGTASVNTGAPESELVLTLGLKLRTELQEHGIEALMTREIQGVNISNAERAQMANAADADLFVRVHADGATDPAVNGVLVLYPASITGWTDDIAEDSAHAATLALQELVKATGAHNRGLSVRSDITGFNWSDVPVFLPEVGLMTNPTEDALMATDPYQDQIVSGLTAAILSYLEIY